MVTPFLSLSFLILGFIHLTDNSRTTKKSWVDEIMSSNVHIHELYPLSITVVVISFFGMLMICATRTIAIQSQLKKNYSYLMDLELASR